MRKKIFISMLSASLFLSPACVYAAEQTDAERIALLEQKIVELEQRIVALEGKNQPAEHAKITDEGILNQGIYIVGEDIPAGKYCFTAKSGIGVIYTYKSYDLYQQDEYSFNEMYQIAPQEFLDGFSDNKDLGFIASSISTSVDNVRLTDGMCLKTDATITYAIQ